MNELSYDARFACTLIYILAIPVVVWGFSAINLAIGNKWESEEQKKQQQRINEKIKSNDRRQCNAFWKNKGEKMGKNEVYFYIKDNLDVIKAEIKQSNK